MRKLILGTAGHIDHGKTALVRALTGTDTDRLPEEKRRGITIDLGFASLTIGDGLELGIVDVPGHEAFIRNMLAGATGIDLALIVVAADEGVMPQTREHLAILELLGVDTAVVALTKTDLVDDDWLELVVDDVRELLALGTLAAAPIVPTSVRTGRGIDQLVQYLAGAAATARERAIDDLARLPIDRVFTVRGTGTVVTGTLWSGTVRHDQNLRLMPQERTVRVRGLHAFGQTRQQVQAGERSAIAIAGVDRDAIRRGDALVTGDGWRAASMITARVRVLPDADRPLRSRQRVRFHLGTAEVLARAVVLEADAIQPGDEGWVQLRLEATAVARAGDRFVLRSYSPASTIAGGIVSEPSAPKRKRLQPADARLLAALHAGTPERALHAAAALHAARGIPTGDLPVATTLAPDAILAALERQDTVREVNGVLFTSDIVDATHDRLREAVEQRHADDPLAHGIDLEELRRSLPPQSHPALVASALDSLLAEGVLQADGSSIRRSGFRPSLDTAQKEVADQILSAVRTGGLAPPALRELPEPLRLRPDLTRIVQYLEREGDLVPIAPGLWMTPDTIDDAVRRLRSSLSAETWLTPGAFREVLGVSRKHLIPLLEFLDRTGVTRRSGDRRALETA